MLKRRGRSSPAARIDRCTSTLLERHSFRRRLSRIIWTLSHVSAGVVRGDDKNHTAVVSDGRVPECGLGQSNNGTDRCPTASHSLRRRTWNRPLRSLYGLTIRRSVLCHLI